MVNIRHYKAYVFTSKDNVSWIRNYTLESFEIIDDDELLIVLQNINRFHLIASSRAERLLYVSGDSFNLMDPYSLIAPIDVSDLFENIEENQIQGPYIIRSDKIIYIIAEILSIKELVPDNSDDWIEYL
ncbi:hypothetical protein F8M41_015099 [Gigaspora margarita]|uniref:Uncharacterized protein n=1 Tax=Gigaspora margarita TaxID=4874 RepID=A0A8H4AQY8_GIGMA|nr:hypothetical protein F8M41_015099 [Gigaspora margarita]